MATVTPGYTFSNNEVLTPAKLNSAAAPLISNITTNDIADANVTTAKIADSNVTTAKIADSNVTTAKIADSNVTTAKIADANVTTAKIADGSVTAAKLASGAVPTSIPVGAVLPFAMNSAPNGWLVANGSNVSRTTYSILFSTIGTIYGAGDGNTTFALPDLRGYFVRGSGTNSDGVTSGDFGVKQSDAIKSHTHSLGTGVGSTASPSFAGYTTGSTTGKENTALPSSPNSTETRPANIALLYCIKF
jgi:microcystin-dependent protein